MVFKVFIVIMIARDYAELYSSRIGRENSDYIARMAIMAVFLG